MNFGREMNKAVCAPRGVALLPCSDFEGWMDFSQEKHLLKIAYLCGLVFWWTKVLCFPLNMVEIAFIVYLNISHVYC